MRDAPKFPSSRRRPGPIVDQYGSPEENRHADGWVPAFAAIGFTHPWPAMPRPSAAHTPLAREAGRGRGPLRSNGRVRGVPVTSFFAAPRSRTAGTFTSDPLVRLSAALSDRVPLTLPTLTP